MTDKKNPAEVIEQELTKQIDEMDRRIDRGGMLSFVLVILAIFIAIYLFIDFFSITDDDSILHMQTQAELIERIDQLESRIQLLEGSESIQ